MNNNVILVTFYAKQWLLNEIGVKNYGFRNLFPWISPSQYHIIENKILMLNTSKIRPNLRFRPDKYLDISIDEATDEATYEHTRAHPVSERFAWTALIRLWRLSGCERWCLRRCRKRTLWKFRRWVVLKYLTLVCFNGYCLESFRCLAYKKLTMGCSQPK